MPFAEVICFNQPLLACQSNDLVNEQTPVQVSQTNQQFRPAPAQIFAVFEPSSVMHDPWNETEGPVSQSLPDNYDMSAKGPSIPNRPTLMKVGEDPNDPWNPCVSVDVPRVNQSIPRFGHDSGPKQTGCSSNTKPLHTHQFFQSWEMTHMTHGTPVNRFMDVSIWNTKSCRPCVLWVFISGWILETLCKP